MRLAIEEVNAAAASPLWSGARLTLVQADSKGDPKTAPKQR